MSHPLNGRRILVVEDEPLVAMVLESILEDMGCQVVGPAGTVREAQALIESDETLDAALLDVNLGGETVFPVAETLAGRGTPMVFSSGYGESGLPDAWKASPSLQKPFTEDGVRAALMRALGVAVA